MQVELSNMHPFLALVLKDALDIISRLNLDPIQLSFPFQKVHTFCKPANAINGAMGMGMGQVIDKFEGGLCQRQKLDPTQISYSKISYSTFCKPANGIHGAVKHLSVDKELVPSGSPKRQGILEIRKLLRLRTWTRTLHNSPTRFRKVIHFVSLQMPLMLL